MGRLYRHQDRQSLQSSFVLEIVRPPDARYGRDGDLSCRVTLELKDLVNWYPEGSGQLEGEQERWGVFTRLQSDDRLSGDADFFGQGLLSHLAIVETKSSYAIGDQVTIRHRRDFFHIESGQQWTPLRKQT